MPPLLAVWATPRSTSTAFETVMRERGDLDVIHEPFGVAYYYGEDRRSQRDTDEPTRAGLTALSLQRELLERSAAGPVFIKDFATYVLHVADDDFLSRYRSSFLVRHPAKVLPSIYSHWPDFTLEEAGFVDLRVLFDRVMALIGEVPPVIDSDDLLDDPVGIVRAYCEAMGLPFTPDALEWQPSERDEVAWYDGGSWHEHLRASTGLQRIETDYAAVDSDPWLEEAYEACLPEYQALWQHRLAPVHP